MKKMGKKCSFLIVLFLSFSLVYAADYKVAYIYKSKPDNNIIDLLSSLKLKVELIKENKIPENLSDYQFLFLGDENFVKDIPITKYPTVIMNHYIPKKIGMVKSIGISQLVSNQPLSVIFQGKEIKVYNKSKDKKGNSLFYYYIDNSYIDPSLKRYIGTSSTSSGSDFGAVAAFGDAGSRLENGNVLEKNVCFFGITNTDYWTKEAEEFFKNCVKYVFDYTAIPPEKISCYNDSDCGDNGLIGLPFCFSNNVFKNFITFKCNNPGTSESYCSNKTSKNIIEKCSNGCYEGKCIIVVCNKNSDCDDGDSTTEDICVNGGTVNSSCVHKIYTNVTKIKIVSFLATPGTNFVVLNFSISPENSSILKGYLVKKDNESWIYVTSNSYTFEGLKENTRYTFYVKAVDINEVNSEELNLSVFTLSSPVVSPPPSSGGSGGGGGGGSRTPISGSFSYCSIEWECSQWSKCENGKQTRVCSYPAGKCKPESEKPSEEQSCIEMPSLESENVSNTPVEEEQKISENEKNSETQIPITGASIAEALGGKNAFRSFLLLITLVIFAYLCYKKFKKKPIRKK